MYKYNPYCRTNVILIATGLLLSGLLLMPAVADYTPVRDAGTLVWDATKFVFSVNASPIATLTENGDLTITRDARVDSIGIGVAADGTSGNVKVNAAVLTGSVKALDGTTSITIAGSTGDVTMVNALSLKSITFVPSTTPSAPSTGCILFCDINGNSNLMAVFAGGALETVATTTP